jgi:hypothetical protein
MGKTPTSPRATPSSSGSGSATAPSKPKETTQDNQFIIDSLNSILATCSKSTDPKISKLVADVRKRFEPLFEKLAKNDFSASVTTNLSQFVQAINSGDTKAAHNIHITLTQNNWEELGSSLMIGIKRLLEVTKN